MPKSPKSPTDGAISHKTRVRLERRRDKAATRAEARATAKAEGASLRAQARAPTAAGKLKARIKRIAANPSATAVQALTKIMHDPKAPARERVAAAALVLKFSRSQPEDENGPRR